MATIKTRDGTEIYYKDWGSGQPVVFSHGWPLSADAWDAQVVFLGERGYRVISNAVLVGAFPPLMSRTDRNPEGLPTGVFDELRAKTIANRSQFFLDLSMPFYGYNRPGGTVSEGVRYSFWLQGMM